LHPGAWSPKWQCLRARHHDFTVALEDPALPLPTTPHNPLHPPLGIEVCPRKLEDALGRNSLHPLLKLEQLLQTVAVQPAVQHLVQQKAAALTRDKVASTQIRLRTNQLRFRHAFAAQLF